ncbi:unnamed protein product, partial [Allacma fusca]
MLLLLSAIGYTYTKKLFHLGKCTYSIDSTKLLKIEAGNLYHVYPPVIAKTDP